MGNKTNLGDFYTSNNELNANVTMTFGNSSVNVSINSTSVVLSPTTSLSANGGVGTSGQLLASNGSAVYWVSLTAGYTANVISANATAVKSNFYVLTSPNIVLTLPASPTAGDTVGVQNSSNNGGCTVARNGSNVMSLAQDVSIDVNNISIQLIYVDATRGWVFLT